MLFLAGSPSSGEISRLLEVILLPYPLGLFVEGLGPLVANDAYSSERVWEQFRADLYHSPRVVWGREVNVLLAGLANRDEPAARTALRRIRAAVEDAGLGQQELWTYEISDGTLTPVRYGTSSDVQLWNLTDLAVQFLLREQR
jgi:hypothetical protein